MLDAVAQAKDEVAKEDVDEESDGDLAEKVFPQVAEEEEDDQGEEDEEAGEENGSRVDHVFELLNLGCRVVDTCANVELGVKFCHRFLGVQKLFVILLRKLAVVCRSVFIVIIVILIVCTLECCAEIGLRVFLHLIIPGLKVLEMDLKNIEDFFLQNFVQYLTCRLPSSCILVDPRVSPNNC